jgi:hypothetical protein
VKSLLKNASAMTIRTESTCPTTWRSSALSPPGLRIEIPVEVETEHHVTTEHLKGAGSRRTRVRLRPRSDRPTCRREIEKCLAKQPDKGFRRSP